MAMWLCGYVAMWISSNFFEFVECQICKDNIFPGCPHILSNIFCGNFGIIKAINTGLQGLENQEIMQNQDFDV